MQDRLVGKVQWQRAQLGSYCNSLGVEGLDKVRGNEGRHESERLHGHSFHDERRERRILGV